MDAACWRRRSRCSIGSTGRCWRSSRRRRPRRDPGEPATGPHALLAAEIAFRRPWYALAVRERGGRTTVGVSGLEPEAAAALLGDWLAGGDAAGIASDRLKLAIDDLRAFCLEAGGAQPGGAGGGPRLER